MKKTTELFLAGIAIFLILLSLVVIFSVNPQQYAYEFEAENVLFVSNFAPPGEQLQKLKEKESFIIASEFLEKGTTSFMTEPITLFNSIFVAQDKLIITVAKTVDLQKNLLSCDTNDGDKLTNRQMNTAECEDFLENSPHTIFLVLLPNSNLEKSKVTVFENSVLIEPNSFEDVSRVSFLILKTMYSDSKEIIGLINGLVEVVRV